MPETSCVMNSRRSRQGVEMSRVNPEPDYASFHRSVTGELYSIKDRIRNLVSHWPTDGESKEVALRSVLRRHLPQSVIVGRGFVVTPTASSTQVDILIVDAGKPTLFKDGDLLIVTPDAVRGVIEVKTALKTRQGMAETIEKLSRIEEMCRDATGRDSVWTGLFIYEGGRDMPQKVLRGMADAYARTRRPVNCVSSGKDTFVRYWTRGADVQGIERGPVWHAYKLEGVAPSYFMGNLIDFIGSVDNSTASFAWFPMIGGKEQYRTHYLPLSSPEPLAFQGHNKYRNHASNDA